MSDEIVDLLADAVGELYDAAIDAHPIASYVRMALLKQQTVFANRLAALRQPGGDAQDGAERWLRVDAMARRVDELNARIAKLEAPRECPECGHRDPHQRFEHDPDLRYCSYEDDEHCPCSQSTYRLALRLGDLERERDEWRATAHLNDGLIDAARRDAEDRYSAEEIAAAMTYITTAYDIGAVLGRLADTKRRNEPPAERAPQHAADCNCAHCVTDRMRIPEATHKASWEPPVERAPESFIDDCLIEPRLGDSPLFLPDGRARLRGYAIVPREKYERPLEWERVGGEPRNVIRR